MCYDSLGDRWPFASERVRAVLPAAQTQCLTLTSAAVNGEIKVPDPSLPKPATSLTLDQWTDCQMQNLHIVA